MRPDHDVPWAVFAQTFVLRREQARLGEMEAGAQLLAAERADRVTWKLLLGLVWSESGRDEDARRLYADFAAEALRAPVGDGLFVPTMAILCVLAVRFGTQSELQRLAELLAPYRGRAMTFGFVAAYRGCTSFYLGLLAEACGRLDEALEQLEMATAFDVRMSARPWIARDQLATARVLLRRRAAGDVVRAATLVAEARESSAGRGLAQIEAAVAELEKALPARLDPDPIAVVAEHGAQPATFRKEGELWTVAYAGTIARLKESRGLDFIACLLSRPGERGTPDARHDVTGFVTPFAATGSA
jgi:hypothetical protein